MIAPDELRWLMSFDQGRAHCGYALTGALRGRVTVVELCGEVNLAHPAGVAAMRDVLTTAAVLGATAWAHEQPWDGASRAVRQKGGNAVKAARIGARIRAGQAETLGYLQALCDAAGLRTRLPAIGPGSAKLALAGHGAARKAMMSVAAQSRCLATWGRPDLATTMTEHMADALGVALAAHQELWYAWLRGTR